MFHRIREAMKDETAPMLQGEGEVEADETFVGGKVKGRRPSAVS